MKKWIGFSSCLVLAAALAGCGVNGSGTKEEAGKAQTEPKESNEPVTLTLYQHATINKDEIEKFIVQPVQKKYPNISFNIVMKEKTLQPTDLAAAGIVPDLIYTTDANNMLWMSLDVPEDLDPLIKQNNFDLKRFEPATINSTRAFGDGKALYALPVMQNIAAMVYNKDIFDKFGVPYPKDGMTWDEVIELARKVTRTDGGVQYIGLAPDTITRIGYGLSLPYVDPATNKATINNDNWKKAYTVMKKIMDIPGFLGPDKKYSYNLTNDFFKNGNVAMAFTWVPDMVSGLDQSTSERINWDFVSLPNFPEALGTGRVVSPHTIMMNKLSKHKKEAFQVMEVFTSNEVQSDLSQNGKVSVLANKNIEKQYGANLPTLKGKNVEGIFKAKPRELHSPVTEFDVIVRQAIDASAKDLADGKDINTVMRETEEKANQKIQEELSKK